MMAEFVVEQVTWHEAEASLRLIREAVFMQEQRVPEELEWDGEDERALHLLAIDPAGKPVGCARILRDGHIGRMAVLRPWRGRGIGQRLLQAALDVVATLGRHEAFLDAQTHAIAFYERLGFVAEGAEFMDAGIPHRQMRRPL